MAEVSVIWGRRSVSVLEYNKIFLLLVYLMMLSVAEII